MNKTKKILIFTLAAALSVTAISCKKADNTNTANKTATNTAANTNQAVNTAPPVAADTTSTDSVTTPTEAYKAAYNARKTKNVPALKKLMSKDILEFFTEISGLGEKKQTVDELLMELCEKAQAPTAEVRNEKINGDKATVEYLNEKGEWQSMDFVKEGGSWKLTIEKPEKGDVEIDSDPKGKSKK